MMTTSAARRDGAVKRWRESGSFAAAVLALAGVAAALNPHVVEKFDEATKQPFTVVRETVSPKGERFLGTFGNETTSIRVDKLKEHTRLVVSMDLYIIGPWRGGASGEASGCEWSLTLDDKQDLVRSTFSNDTPLFGSEQTYPDPSGGLLHRAGTGRMDDEPLGYVAAGENERGESVYRLSFVVKHSGASAMLNFSAKGLTDAAQVWGIDNFEVDSFQEPDVPAEMRLDMLPIADGLSVANFHEPGRGGGVGSNPPVDRPIGGGPPGGAPGGGGGDPTRPPGPSTQISVPTPGAAVLAVLGGMMAARRKRRR